MQRPRDSAPHSTATLSWSADTRCAGSILYREASLADRVFTVRSGIVKLVAHLPNGRTRIIGLHGRGAVIGLVTPASGSEIYDHTAIAMTDVQVGWTHARQIRRLRARDPQGYLDLVERHCEELRNSKRWITDFSADTTTRRIARLIKYLAELQDPDVPAAVDQVELLTCQDMADVIGTSPESASRALAKLKRTGVLTAGTRAGGRHYDIDRGALEGVAAF